MPGFRRYAQCTLERVLADGTKAVDVAWIPAELARVGGVLRIRKPDHAPPTREGGWVVVARGDVRSEESLREYERDHLRQRRASDI